MVIASELCTGEAPGSKLLKVSRHDCCSFRPIETHAPVSRSIPRAVLCTVPYISNCNFSMKSMTISIMVLFSSENPSPGFSVSSGGTRADKVTFSKPEVVMLKKIDRSVPKSRTGLKISGRSDGNSNARAKSSCFNLRPLSSASRTTPPQSCDSLASRLPSITSSRFLSKRSQEGPMQNGDVNEPPNTPEMSGVYLVSSPIRSGFSLSLVSSSNLVESLQLLRSLQVFSLQER
mmetsp:Transcript_14109/g.15849  ORF Transcript_14109/g.15849 Transcript_14109/m.15849 type:complete len:233 (+) Transcript_14109:4679-5377(+)